MFQDWKTESLIERNKSVVKTAFFQSWKIGTLVLKFRILFLGCTAAEV